MTTLDVPCAGRATFHRLGVRALRDKLLDDEARRRQPGPLDWRDPLHCAEIVATYLRPIAYLERGIST